MKPIAQQDSHPIWLIKMQPDDEFRSPCLGEDFAALVAIYDGAISSESRNSLCDALIAQGCRNGVFWGYDCSVWDDSLDWAFLATDPNFNPPNSRFVMSSWHDNEPLEEALFGLLKCSAFDNFVPRNFVVIVLGDGSCKEIIAAVELEVIGIDDG